MILVLSSDEDAHVPFVTQWLDRAQAEYRCFDTALLPAEARLALDYGRPGGQSRRLEWAGRSLDLDQVSAIWFRRPRDPRAAQQVADNDHRELTYIETYQALAGTLYTLDCRWLPGPPRLVYAAENKPAQLALAPSLGFRIPRTIITNRPEDLLDFYAECDGQMVTKALYRGHGERDGERFVCYTRPVRRRDLASYQAVRYAPIIAQEYVPKKVEIRVTVVGTCVFAAEIHSQQSRSSRHDWRLYEDHERTRHVVHVLPTEIASQCVRLVHTMGLCFGAIDLVLTPAGDYVFLEINPNGQWAWIEQLTGMPIGAAIAATLVGSPDTARRMTHAVLA